MPDQGDLRICGKVYDSNDMTFREEREVRAIVREHLVPDPDVDFEDMAMGDILPAFCLVLRRRDDPEFTLDDALELKQRDVLIADDEQGNGAAPPTGASTVKPKATSSRRGASAKK
jgi:hypothetical protein